MSGVFLLGRVIDYLSFIVTMEKSKDTEIDNNEKTCEYDDRSKIVPKTHTTKIMEVS